MCARWEIYVCVGITTLRVRLVAMFDLLTFEPQRYWDLFLLKKAMDDVLEDLFYFRNSLYASYWPIWSHYQERVVSIKSQVVKMSIRDEFGFLWFQKGIITSRSACNVYKAHENVSYRYYFTIERCKSSFLTTCLQRFQPHLKSAYHSFGTNLHLQDFGLEADWNGFPEPASSIEPVSQYFGTCQSESNTSRYVGSVFGRKCAMLIQHPWFASQLRQTLVTNRMQATLSEHNARRSLPYVHFKIPYPHMRPK